MLLYLLVFLSQAAPTPRFPAPTSEALKVLAGPRPPNDAIMGTWNVTSTPTGFSTCGIPTQLQNSVYQWLVAVNGQIVDVTVVGSTTFPTLKGSIRGRTITLVGYDGRKASSVFRLHNEGDRITGVRIWLGDSVHKTPCMTEFDVVATR